MKSNIERLTEFFTSPAKADPEFDAVFRECTARRSSDVPTSSKTLTNLSGAVRRHARDVTALRERVDYLTVAAMRGDSRFTKAEFVDPAFDSVKFDENWVARGKRVPTANEIFGESQ